VANAQVVPFHSHVSLNTPLAPVLTSL